MMKTNNAQQRALLRVGVFGPTTALLAVGALSCSGAPTEFDETGVVEQAIYHGEPSNEPTVVRVGSCSGTAISERVVATAAHCFKNYSFTDDVLRMKLTIKFHDGNEVFTPVRIHRFPGYSPGEAHRDLALVHVPGALFTPARIWDDALYTGMRLDVFGYGFIYNSGTPYLATQHTGDDFAQIRVDKFGNTKFESKARTARVCEGDSGGPASRSNTIAGVTRPGVVGVLANGSGLAGRCAESNSWMRYARLAPRMSWIEGLGFLTCDRHQASNGYVQVCKDVPQSPRDDFDGDGRSDFATWRPSNGYWTAVKSSNGGTQSVQWGQTGDVPMPGDFDGDGKTDFAVWRPGDGYWHVIRSSDGGSQSQQWGAPSDVPVFGDFDGDGRSDYAVRRPSDGMWHVIWSSDGGVRSTQWGAPGDIPVFGDFDGDFITDHAVWRPSNGYWYIIRSSDGGITDFQWGMSSDVPVSGDFDGDGKSDFAVWRPSDGYWHIIRSSDGAYQGQQWGMSTDIPISGDYDGDGKTDYAVRRPSDQYFHISKSTGGTASRKLGLQADLPLPGSD